MEPDARADLVAAAEAINARLAALDDRLTFVEAQSRATYEAVGRVSSRVFGIQAAHRRPDPPPGPHVAAHDGGEMPPDVAKWLEETRRQAVDLQLLADLVQAARQVCVALRARNGGGAFDETDRLCAAVVPFRSIP